MKQILPEKMIPALDSLQAVWFKMADEEQRVESVIRDTPEADVGVNPEREEMIRVHGIVRAHRRFTRQCIDLISWGDSDEKLPHFTDKAKVEIAETAQKAAETFGSSIETAADDCITALYNLGYADEDKGRDVTEENVRAIARNLRYALDSAKADLRKGTR